MNQKHNRNSNCSLNRHSLDCNLNTVNSINIARRIDIIKITNMQCGDYINRLIIRNGGQKTLLINKIDILCICHTKFRQ